jgi:type I restriction enzyme R subunit
MKGKESTMILDFVNEIEDIQRSFQDYYQTTFLEEETDPNKLHNLSDELYNFEMFARPDVDEFAAVFFDPKIPNEKLQPILDRVVNTFRYTVDEIKREDFRSMLQSYVRLYSYISQIIDWADTDLEKLYVFSRNLNRKLPRKVTKMPFEVQDSIDLDSFRIQKTFAEQKIELERIDGSTNPITSSVSQFTEEEKDLLSNIIKTLNESYGANLSDDDKLDVERLRQKVYESTELKAAMNPKNTKENIKLKFDKAIDSMLMDFVEKKLDLYKKLSDPRINKVFKDIWFEAYFEEMRKVG